MNPPSSRRSLLQQQQPLGSPATTFTFNSPFTILILLTVLFFMAFFSLYIRRFYTLTNSETRHRISENAATLPVVLLRSLPVVPYGSELKMLNECSICLSEFEESETVKVIPYCRHGFHPVCIDTWLSSHVSCPLCRLTRVFPALMKLERLLMEIRRW